METTESRRKALRAQVDRACERMAIVLAISWLFSAFSYYVTKKTGTEWFARSGSVMALTGAVATFRITGLLQKTLVTGLREDLGSLQRGMELSFDPPKAYQMTAYFSYLTGIVGTVIWGYGDVFFRWVSSFAGG
jgi:hypothetical protein